METIKKHFYVSYGIGRSKYLVNYWNGQKRHSDGSLFYDIQIFKNKAKLETFTNNLRAAEYRQGTITQTN